MKNKQQHQKIVMRQSCKSKSNLLKMFNDSELKVIFWTPEGLSQDPFIYTPLDELK